ncbi:MAG: hypothetical protein LBF38_06185, partial [Deltaproteobacteria bacterium]|nr:hypothetical protein [Deltaproteobacteria bacterium]
MPQITSLSRPALETPENFRSPFLKKRAALRFWAGRGQAKFKASSQKAIGQKAIVLGKRAAL